MAGVVVGVIVIAAIAAFATYKIIMIRRSAPRPGTYQMAPSSDFSSRHQNTGPDGRKSMGTIMWILKKEANDEEQILQLWSKDPLVRRFILNCNTSPRDGWRHKVDRETNFQVHDVRSLVRSPFRTSDLRY